MAEPSEIFVPAVAAVPIVEARLVAGAAVLGVAGFSARRGDTTPDPGCVADYEAGERDADVVARVLASWPQGSDRFVQLRFTAPPV